MGDSVLTRSTRTGSSQWNNQKKKKITSLRHKVRLQPQTKTMENTCSVLSSGKEYQAPQNIPTCIEGESTCTVTPEGRVTQGK